MNCEKLTFSYVCLDDEDEVFIKLPKLNFTKVYFSHKIIKMNRLQFNMVIYYF